MNLKKKLVSFVPWAVMAALSVGPGHLSFAGSESGGGGNEIGLDVQASASAAIRDIQKSDAAAFADLNLQELADLARSAKFVERRNTLFVEFEGKKQEVVARNFPEQGLIEINRWRWMNIQDPIAKKALALHEVLSLQRLESTGSYLYSSAYLAGVSTSVIATGRVVPEEFPADPDEIVPIDVGREVTTLEVAHAKVVCSVPEGSGTDTAYDARRLTQSIGGQIYSGVFGKLPTYWKGYYGYDSVQDAMTVRVETKFTNGHWYSSVRDGASLQFSLERKLNGMFKVTLTPAGGRETTLKPASRIPYLDYDIANVPATEFDSWGNPLEKPDNSVATNLRIIQRAGQSGRVPLINARSGRVAPNNLAIDVNQYKACLIGVLKSGR